MREGRDKWISLAAALCLLAFFAVFAVLNLRWLPVFIDGDIYADMELAREMWRQGTLFPDNWVFGNQFYVTATPVLAALFYGLTGSMNLAMGLATTAMGLLLLASFCWMLRAVLPSPATRLCVVLLFVAAPMGTRLLLEPEGQLFFVLASYYACYLITLFVVFGDYARALERPGALRLPALLLSLGLSFAAGMQSLRQTAVMVLPLLALEGLALAGRLLRRGGALPAERRNAALRCLGCAAANLLGYGLMQRLQIPNRSIYSSFSAGSESFLARLHELWAAWRGISGLDAALFGEAPLFFGLFFALQLLAILAAALRLLRRRQLDGLARLWLLCVLSLAVTVLAGLAANVRMREIYLFVWYLLAALSPALLLREGKGKRLAALLLALMSLGNLYFSYGSSLRWAAGEDCSEAQRFCAEAEAAGIEIVYGDWSIVPGNVVWSDGALTGGFWDEIFLHVRESINLQDLYGESNNEKALYLLGPWGREYFLRHAQECGARLELFGEYGRCIAYRSDTQLMYGAEKESPGS